MSTIAPAVAVFNDFSATASPVSAVAPSLFIGVAISLFALIFVLTRVVKGLVEALKMTVGPLLKALGVLVVIMVFLMAVMLAGTSAVAPTQSLMPGSLIVAEK